jgi:transglutaminase-like putative cysteine protease
MCGLMRPLELVHRSLFEYVQPVALGEHRLMFRPRDSHDLRLLDTTLAIDPAAEIRWLHDPFGNSIALATFAAPTQKLEFVSTITLEHYGQRSSAPPIEPHARELPFSYATDEAPDLARFIERHYSDPDGAVLLWAPPFLHDAESNGTYETLSRMCEAIRSSFTYSMRFEFGTQTPVTTLQRKSGTCRDFALLMMEAARGFGLAARFVTGYLYDPALDAGDGREAGSAYPHAWMEVYLPGGGWIQFDPTNGLEMVGELIRVAVARDPEQAMPIKGSFTGPPGACINAITEVKVRAIPSMSPSSGTVSQALAAAA